MHGSAPKLLIIAKKEVIGDDGPNFDGDGYMEAKKKMMSPDEPVEETRIYFNMPKKKAPVKKKTVAKKAPAKKTTKKSKK